MAKKAKKEKKLHGKQENIDALDVRITKADDRVTNLKKGNKNDKIVADLLEAKVNDTWVKQKEKLETEE